MTKHFKSILSNMTKEELLNLIYIYDQYVQKIGEMALEEGEDITPCDLETFYYEFHVINRIIGGN